MLEQKRRLRIGMVCPYSFDEPGGVQIHAIDLCTKLRERGHSVSLIGPGEPGADVPSFVVLGGPSIPIRYNGSVARLSFGWRTVRYIRRWIEQGNFDVVHIHEPNSPSYSMLTLQQAEGPIVATYHASASNSRVLKLALPFLRPLLDRIQGGIAVSEEARRWQVENLAGDPVLVPNGVDTSAYAQAQPLQELASDRPRMMFLGRFDEPRKGLGVLLDALPMILDAVPNAELLIAGGGDTEALWQRIRNKGISVTEGLPYVGASESSRHASVRILGRVSEEVKARALQSSDVYVAPNTGGESFGIVLVEAMAAGAAVVASDIPAFAAVGDNGGAAALFANHSSEALAKQVISLLVDSQRREKLIAQARLHSQQYDWSTVTDAVERVYETVAIPGRKVRLT